MNLASFPDGARAVIDAKIGAARSPAFVQVDPDGVIVAVGGDIARYGIALKVVGAPAEDAIELLMGLLPAAAEPLQLPAVTTGGATADLLVAHHGGFDWVVFLDVTQDIEHERVVQQRAYDEALNAADLSRTVDRFVGRQMAEAIARVSAGGPERRTVTILFADLCGFTDLAAKCEPDEVLSVLDTYLDPMLGAILAHDGVVDKIIGDAVMGLFGFGHNDPDAPRKAMAAARSVIAAVGEVAAFGKVRPLDVAVGIATGDVVIGVLGHSTRRTVTVIGHAVNLAARLQSAAGNGEVMVNERTHLGLGLAGTELTTVGLQLKGIRGEVIAHRLAAGASLTR